MIFSPLTRKRLRAFRRNRRSWWAFWALVGVFLFSLAAEWVCPCDPRATVDVASLSAYREVERTYSYEVRDARWSVDKNGNIYDFEGPADIRDEIVALNPSRSGSITLQSGETFDLLSQSKATHQRYRLVSRLPPRVTETAGALSEIRFPFRPCWAHPFGIDAGGRDVYARVVHGLRISLVFGLTLAFFGLLAGLVVGALEGYYGGWVDLLGQRLTEVWSALPFLYVMIFIGSTVGRSFVVLLISYALFDWIAVSYYVRAEFLRLRTRTFVEAARCQGLSASRVIFGHILPNALTPLITLFPFLLMGAIGSLAALDFLGFGLPPLTPSCGELLNQAQQFRSAWWLILFPSLALFWVMFLAVLVGEGLRDAFDPRPKSHLE